MVAPSLLQNCPRYQLFGKSKVFVAYFAYSLSVHIVRHEPSVFMFVCCVWSCPKDASKGDDSSSKPFQEKATEEAAPAADTSECEGQIVMSGNIYAYRFLLHKQVELWRSEETRGVLWGLD